MGALLTVFASLQIDEGAEGLAGDEERQKFWGNGGCDGAGVGCPRLLGKVEVTGGEGG